MPPRKLHFVGSLPKTVMDQGPYAAMDWAFKHSHAYTGDQQLTGAPGDIDHRWIIDYLDRLVSNEKPALRAIRNGDSADYDTMPILRPGESRVMNSTVFSMNRTAKLKTVIDDYRTLRSRVQGFSSPDTMPSPLRISLPNPLDLALFVFVGKVDFTRHLLRTLRGTYLALRNLKHFIAAMEAEVIELQEYADAGNGDIEDPVDRAVAVPVVFAFESPGVRYALGLVPRFLRPTLARLLAKQVAHCLGLIWHVDTEVHLCDGDLGHKNIVRTTSMRESVLFLNALASMLEQRGIEVPPVHVPVASGSNPPPTDQEFFEPLADLAESWRLYAGVVDENDLKASRVALHLFETHSNRTAEAVGCACGLGRRTEGEALAAIGAMVDIAGTDRADVEA